VLLAADQMDREERREQILSHALALFAARGYHLTQISDIIEAAGIARGTFYLYFDSKRAIFSTLLDRLFTTFQGTIFRIQVGEGHPEVGVQVRGNLDRVIDAMTDHRDLVRILLRAAVGLDPEFDGKVDDFYRGLLSILRGSVQMGVEMGLIRPCDPEVVAIFVLGGLKELAYQYLVADDQTPRREHVAAEFLAFVFGGLFRPGVTV
jgi:AcrR family transcriptional regulator